MNEPPTNLDRSRSTYVGVAVGITSLAIAGSLLFSVISPGQFREEGRIFFTFFTVIAAICTTLAIGLGANKYRTASGVSAVWLGVAAFGLTVFSLARLAAKLESATDNSLSYAGGTIFATGEMWLPVADRKSQSLAFHPAVAYRPVTIHVDATGVDVYVRFKNGIVDSTARPPGTPRPSQERLSFTPSSTEEHTIEIVREVDAGESIVHSVRVEQQ